MRPLALTKERLFATIRPNGNCLVWTGSTAGQRKRYGSIKYRGKHLKAHRVSYELHFGPIPHRNVVMHTCDNPLCINPAHLALGTQLDNVHDMLSKNRANKAKGERNGAAKLTSTIVAEIRRRYVSRHHQHGTRALARAFGVSKTTIARIISGVIWRKTTAPVR